MTIFNLGEVKDNSSIPNPNVYPDGFEHVIVNGVFVIRDEQFVENAFPGRRISGSL